MKVSYNWLNNYVDGKLPEVSAVADALMFHSFEVEGVETVGKDHVLDLKVLQRGHDCLGHRGVAKELSAILKLPLNQQYDPFTKKPDFSKVTSEVQVKVDTDLCARYIAGYIKGIKVGPSPEWLKQALEAVGQRSINNIVDATNLVMFNIGQPMHAFDAAKIGKSSKGKYEIEVRDALTHEAVTDLTGKDYILEPGNLVIGSWDKDNLPTFLGIAGVKGGAATAIDNSTTDIVLESANFDGGSVRRTAAALKLRTDASTRFEQGLSPELAAYGMQQAVDLILHIAGGELGGFVDVYPKPQQPTILAITTERISKVLGIEVGGAEVADVFQRLGLPYKEQEGVFEVHVPFERLDLTIAEDLTEEVGRIFGYDRIPAVPLPPSKVAPSINPMFAAAEHARKMLCDQGYNEVLTSVFAERGERQVANKVGGERPYLRDSLIPGLIEALSKNIPNTDLLGLRQIKLFEIGTVWKDGKEIIMVGTAEGDSKSQNTKEGKVSEKELQPLEADHYQDLPLSETERYRPFSKYPYIVRDVAVWTPAGTDEEEVRTLIKKEAGALAQTVRLFDRFEKGERTSLAYRIVFQSFERTLTEAEANSAMEHVAAALKAKGFEIR